MKDRTTAGMDRLAKPHTSSKPSQIAAVAGEQQISNLDSKNAVQEDNIVDDLDTETDSSRVSTSDLPLGSWHLVRTMDEISSNLNPTLALEAIERKYKQSEAHLSYAQHQLSIQIERINVLEDQVRNMEQQIAHSYPELRMQIHQRSNSLIDARLGEMTRTSNEEDGLKTHPSENRVQLENELLLQTIERQQWEIEKWKGEAMGRGSEAVSRCWQGSVDEAVRKQREKDRVLITALTDEIRRLQQINQT